MPTVQIVYPKEQIRQRVHQLAADITLSLEGERPLLVSVLKGSVVFLADLVRAMKIEPDVDFISISSYQSKAERTGVVRIVKDLEEPLEGRQVIVVEDIIDTGLTLHYLLGALETRGPRSIKVCALVDKPVRRIAERTLDFVGFETTEFLIGYGLDFKGRYRNLPYLAAVSDVAGLAESPDSLNHLFSDDSLGAEQTRSANLSPREVTEL